MRGKYEKNEHKRRDGQNGKNRTNVELSESKGLNELQKMVVDKKSFTELKELQSMATSMVGGVASGAMAGAIKSIIDTSILDEDGNLTSESDNVVELTRQRLEEVMA